MANKGDRTAKILSLQVFENATVRSSERKKKDNFKHGLSKLVQRATHKTTIHGVRYIFDNETNILRRFLWILVMIACAAFFGQQLFVRVSSFISNPKSVNMEVVYAQSMRFPQVILCNKNAFKLTTLYPMLFRSVRTFFSIQPDQITPELVAQIAEYDRRRTMYVGVPTNMTSTFIENRHQLEDMLIECTYKGNPCSIANFSLVLSEYGVCYRFVSNEDNIDITSPGQSNGLSLMINIEQYAYTYGQKSSAGLDIFFKDAEKPPVTAAGGVSVQPGGETSIGLDLSVTDELPRPNGACDSSLSLKYYKKYSRSACRQECLTDFIRQQCSCKSPGMPGNIPYCDLITLYNCSYPLQVKFPLLPESLACDCPPRCHETVYSSTVNYAQLSNLIISTILQEIHSSSGPKLLREIIKAKEILIYHSSASAEINANNTEIIMNTVGNPLAEYIDVVKPLYESIAEMKRMFRQFNGSSSYTSSSPSSQAMINEFNNELDALLSNLTSIDLSIFCAGAFIDNAGTTRSNLKFCLGLYILGSNGQTGAFELMGINGKQAPIALYLRQNLIPTCQKSASKVDEFFSALSSDKNANISMIHSLTDNFTATLQNIQTVLSDVLVGMKNISLYAEASLSRIGLGLIDETFVRENLLKVNIFFKGISYTQITKQLSDSIISLICDIGGTFGLCLGASIMSIYELLDLIISLVLFYRK